MKIPYFLKGTSEMVVESCKQFIEKCVDGDGSIKFVDNYLEEFDESCGLIKLGRRYESHDECYRPTLLSIMFFESSIRRSRDWVKFTENLFRQLIKEPWGLLIILSSEDDGWLLNPTYKSSTGDIDYDPERIKLLKEALREHWGIINAAGNIYWYRGIKNIPFSQFVSHLYKFTTNLDEASYLDLMKRKYVKLEDIA